MAVLCEKYKTGHNLLLFMWFDGIYP